MSIYASACASNPALCQPGLFGGSPLVPALSSSATRAAGTKLVTDTFDGSASSELIVANVKTGTLVASLSGSSTLTVSIVTSATSTSCSRIRLTFTPTCAGTFSSTLTLTYTSNFNSSIVSLQYPVQGVARAPVFQVFNQALPTAPLGSGLAPSSSLGTNFGSVAPGSAKSITFTLSNSGARPLTVRKPVLTQNPSSGTPWVLSGLPATTFIVLASSTTSSGITLTFTAPTSSCGVFNATLVFNDDDCGVAYTINLQATVTSTAAPVISGCSSPASTQAQLGRCSAVVMLPSQPTATYCNQPWPVTGPVPTVLNNVYPVGTNSFTFTSTNPLGNSSTCSITVTVTDNQPPSISCPRSFSVSQCFSTVRYLPPVPVDNCQANVTQTAGLASGSVFPLGATTNTFVALDPSGNSANCSFTVTVTAATCSSSTSSSAALDPTIDNDGDGITIQQGDCCETTDQCRDPYLVNPGAAEIAGNGIDDNCNGRVDENRDCDLIANEQRYTSFTQTNIELFTRALGLCERVEDDADYSSGYFYYSPYHSRITLADGITANKPDPLQVALLRSFGGITAISGNGILMSTGAARLNGELGKTGVDMNMNTASTAPTAFPTATSSTQLPFPAGCPIIENQAYDSVRIRFNIRMPRNFNGFAVRFLFGAEQPDGMYPPTNLCQAQKDFFLILTDAKSAPPGGNIAVDYNRDYISTLNPNPQFWSRCRQYSADRACIEGPYSLTNTGYDGAARWTTVGANVVPGKRFFIDFVIFDGGDHVRDSFVFVDQVFYVVEAASSPTYGPRSFSDMAISSAKGPSYVLSSLTNSTAVIQYSIRNNGPEPAQDLFLSLTPPRGTFLVSASQSSVALQCTTVGSGVAALKKCAIQQSLQARGVRSISISLLLLLVRRR